LAQNQVQARNSPLNLIAGRQVNNNKILKQTIQLESKHEEYVVDKYAVDTLESWEFH